MTAEQDNLQKNNGNTTSDFRKGIWYWILKILRGLINLSLGLTIVWLLLLCEDDNCWKSPFIYMLFFSAIPFVLLMMNLLKKIRWRWFFISYLFLVLTVVGSIICIYIMSSEAVTSSGTYDKPIIYLYPIESTIVTVRLGNPQNLTHTYPKYVDNKWQMMAQPNGMLTDTVTNRTYYALYWEGKNTVQANMKEGFVVKGNDIIAFLEEKLSQLGLNEREANEFIIYWLPRLENVPYNFIRFQTRAEQDKNMPLSVQPQPDTVIRVLMEFKNLNHPISVVEQILPQMPIRNSFTVVEWGGTQIK